MIAMMNILWERAGEGDTQIITIIYLYCLRLTWDQQVVSQSVWVERTAKEVERSHKRQYRLLLHRHHHLLGESSFFLFFATKNTLSLDRRGTSLLPSLCLHRHSLQFQPSPASPHIVSRQRDCWHLEKNGEQKTMTFDSFQVQEYKQCLLFLLNSAKNQFLSCPRLLLSFSGAKMFILTDLDPGSWHQAENTDWNITQVRLEMSLFGSFTRVKVFGIQSQDKDKKNQVSWEHNKDFSPLNDH